MNKEINSGEYNHNIRIFKETYTTPYSINREVNNIYKQELVSTTVTRIVFIYKYNNLHTLYHNLHIQAAHLHTCGRSCACLLTFYPNFIFTL